MRSPRNLVLSLLTLQKTTASRRFNLAYLVLRLKTDPLHIAAKCLSLQVAICAATTPNLSIPNAHFLVVPTTPVAFSPTLHVVALLHRFHFNVAISIVPVAFIML